MDMKYVLKKSFGWILIITPIALIGNVILGLLVTLGVATVIISMMIWGIVLIMDV